MLKLTFDKGLETQRELLVDHIYEYPITITLNATYDKEVKSASDFPDISGFEKNPDFSTVELTDDDGMQIPLSSGYNYISDIIMNYYDRTKTVNLTVTLTHSENDAADAEA